MRKFTSLFCAIIMASSFTFAASGWFQDYVLINANSGGVQYYWIGDNPSYGTSLQSKDFGVTNTLVITGCDMKYWNDSKDRAGGSFFYKIMSSDGLTEIIAPIETVWDQVGPSGNDYQGTKTVSINLLTGLAKNTTYKLHVWAKNWNGISSGGDSWLSNGSADYVATFTTDNLTGLDQQSNSDLKISSKSGLIEASFEGTKQVELYSVTGQLIRSATVENQFTQAVKNGAYMLRVNGQTHKVVVR
ncbi:MAG: T9SS type A sorting domain-containing protein [Paludibacter sp.]